MGGLIERSEIMMAVPADMGSTLVAITLLVGLMVFVGMVMDPFGAVILVSATVAQIAYKNGINPVHFWMIVLTAFELGYLSPPVALNQLLARQVVGEKEMAEADAEVRHLGFFYRYERWILPLLVMVPTLILVAYGPYFFKLFGWYQ
nr:DctM-like transporters [uncultured bacterium]